jgi:hypothetical protein
VLRAAGWIDGKTCRVSDSLAATRYALVRRPADGHMAGRQGRRRMTSFDDRENAFENKFAHDAEMQFKAEARRNKLTGLWAAELMGLTGDAAADYARTVVAADFEEAGIEDVVRKVAADLAGRASADDIRAKMAQLLPVAKAQLMSEL